MSEAARSAIRGVVFDLDGTLVLSDLDFARIRAEIGIVEKTPILEYLEKQTPAARRRGMEILQRHEFRAARTATLNDGAGELLQFLRRHELKTAIVTRNSLQSAQIVMSSLGFTVDAIVTRADAPPKPAPQPLLLACRHLGLGTHEVLFVGDYAFDRDAGANAGIETYIVCNGREPSRPDELRSLHDLVGLLERRRAAPEHRCTPDNGSL
jgi:HAD superfamily hydrolase (TIGR01509 family)